MKLKIKAVFISSYFNKFQEVYFDVKSELLSKYGSIFISKHVSAIQMSSRKWLMIRIILKKFFKSKYDDVEPEIQTYVGRSKTKDVSN